MKHFKFLFPALLSAVLLTSCGVANNMTSNHNLLQTNVVLQEANYKIVKNVSATVTSSYVLGIGGLSKRTLYDNAVAELTQKAELTGSQALTNVTIKQSCMSILGIYSQISYTASATVVEFYK